MFQDKIRISAVSYLNTLPFIYGIKNFGLPQNFSFELNYPSICAQKLIDDEVDISLIPVAAIPKLREAFFITDYCIGAFKQVKTVLLLSDVPLGDIKVILLDYQSRTSVNLVQVLARKYWNISPEWHGSAIGFENKIKGQVAGVVIGDRTFDLTPAHKYVYDLSAEWYKFTGLPFVFAAWVANKPLDKEPVDLLNHSLAYGVSRIDEVVADYQNEYPDSGIDLYTYFTENISFAFDKKKKESLRLFYQSMIELSLLTEKEVSGLIF